MFVKADGKKDAKDMHGDVKNGRQENACIGTNILESVHSGQKDVVLAGMKSTVQDMKIIAHYGGIDAIINMDV